MDIPDLKLDCSSFIEGDGLCKKGSTDCTFSIVVKLVLQPKDV